MRIGRPEAPDLHNRIGDVHGRREPGNPHIGKVNAMLALLLVLLIIVVLFGAGFALHILWWIAVAALVLWLLGFLFRGRSGSGRSRWYRW